MVRFVLVGLAIPFLLSIGGCPESPPDETAPADLTPTVQSPENAKNGESVVMKAILDADAGNVTYQWFQTYGRKVDIIGADTADASFVAPSLPADQTLRFRLDVVGPDGSIHSKDVEVVVAADPDYGLDDSIGDGSSDENLLPRVRLTTNKGTIVIELNREKAPLTVNNFLRYVDDGFYDDTLFHRVISDFVIQGGGFDLSLELKETRPAIRNESDNGLKNDRGTIAMARLTSLDSATSQFYINLIDNDSLNAKSGTDGYAVFGRVVEGMDVVDDIAAVDVGTRNGMQNVPVEDVILQHAERVQE